MKYNTPFSIFTATVLLMAAAGMSITAKAQWSPSLTGANANRIVLLEVPQIDAESLRARDKARKSISAEKVVQFAEPYATAASAGVFGEWEDAGNGNVVWRLFVSAPGSTDINLGITEIHIPKGGQVTLSTMDGEFQAGPYTHQDNTEYRQLWTPILPGDMIVVEAVMPATQASQFIFEVGQVNRGYADVFRDGFQPMEKAQGSCNLDTICPGMDDWRNEERSVAMYSIFGVFACSGSLVMNQTADFRPFFLTANHCLDTASEANSVVVYWNYRSPVCGQLSGGSLSQNQAGATLRATYAPSDVTLLELNANPNPAFNVYFAGWDRSGATPASVIGIHHPDTREKAGSFEDQALQSTAYLSSTVNAGASHWRVIDWDIGTTEPGSSGSAIWDRAGRRIVGQLHGGYAACGNNESDWYGKLSVSWTGGGSAATRLSSWLDPNSTGITTLNGSNPAATPLANDHFANATLISGASGTAQGSNQGATAEVGEPTYTSSGTNTVWWRWTAPSSGTFIFDTVGSNFDTVLGVFTGTAVNNLTQIALNDDAGGLGFQSRVSFSATAGTIYRIQISGFGSDSGTIRLNWGPATLSISPGSRSHGSTAVVGQTVGVTANVSWSATASQPWITISSGSSGATHGSLVYSLSQNSGATRTGTITFTGGGITRTFTITQSTAAPTTIFFDDSQPIAGSADRRWSFMSAWNLSTGNLQVSPNWYNGRYVWNHPVADWRQWIARFTYNQGTGRTSALAWYYDQPYVQ